MNNSEIEAIVTTLCNSILTDEDEIKLFKELLTLLDYEIHTKNSGIYLVAYKNGYCVDLWPTTYKMRVSSAEAPAGPTLHGAKTLCRKLQEIAFAVEVKPAQQKEKDYSTMTLEEAIAWAEKHSFGDECKRIRSRMVVKLLYDELKKYAKLPLGKLPSGRPAQANGSTWKHDCPDCIFAGVVTSADVVFDIYYCKAYNRQMTEVIARYGNHPSHCIVTELHTVKSELMKQAHALVKAKRQEKSCL